MDEGGKAMIELIKSLIEKLGVSEGQARGGLAALMKLVRGQLDKGEFAKVEEELPGASGLADDAPEAGGLGGALGALGSALGGKAESLGGLASLAGVFEKLGLDADDIARFAKVVMSFLEKKGATDVKALIEKALK
jgi:hypothetical protein